MAAFATPKRVRTATSIASCWQIARGPLKERAKGMRVVGRRLRGLRCLAFARAIILAPPDDFPPLRGRARWPTRSRRGGDELGLPARVLRSSAAAQAIGAPRVYVRAGVGLVLTGFAGAAPPAVRRRGRLCGGVDGATGTIAARRHGCLGRREAGAPADRLAFHAAPADADYRRGRGARLLDHRNAGCAMAR